MPHTINQSDQISKPEVIYQDQDLLVVNKPAGLLSVPGLSQPENLLDLLRQSFPNIRVVHRLDMATSGLILFALNHPTQVALGKQFEHKKIHKRYIARVEGRVLGTAGDIVAPLICDWPQRPKQKVDWAAGKKAHTRYLTLSRDKDSSLLHLFPVTGRSHQLRVHCQFIGHSIIGDNLYSEVPHQRLLLHAEFLAFSHPTTNNDASFHCPSDFD